MCRTCGCSGDLHTHFHGHEHHHEHEHGHGHEHHHAHEHHPHDHTHDSGRIVRFEAELLAKNDALASQNRAWLAARGICALNLMGAPGAGKTTLLEATLETLAEGAPPPGWRLSKNAWAGSSPSRSREGAGGRVARGAGDSIAIPHEIPTPALARERGREPLQLPIRQPPGGGGSALRSPIPVAVLEGDQETERDAERIRRAGCRAVQITTGAGCHLDASMVARGLAALEPEDRSLVFIENVGNLVCPALFSLGERAKVVVMSVTEGDDKPAKYPHMFRAADVLVLNKIDLLPHVDFDVARCLADARALRPGLRVFEVSARTSEGIDAWCAYLHAELGGAP